MKHNTRHTLSRAALLGFAAVALAANSARAFQAKFEAQSFGNTNWSSANPTGWAELDFIPTRVAMSGGPANNQTITIKFDHTKTQGSRVIQGIQNLFNFTPSANVVLTAGPTLSAPVGQDIWSYTFTLNLTNNKPGYVEFFTRLAAGSHHFVGNSLQIGGLGTMSFTKPAAASGNPDLALVKVGPTSVNAGQVITYTLNYQNALAGTTATGVQVFDILPNEVQLVSAPGAVLVGNTLTWDLGHLARGASGTLTYKVAVTNTITTGFSFQNSAEIASSQNDANPSNNFSRVVTVVTSNCIPPTIVVEPESVATCGEAVTLAVAANGSAPLSYQWRKNGANIAGAVGDTFTTAEAGNYDVVISNLCGSQTSASATVTVGAPVIAEQPVGATACADDSVALLVEATGDELTYQWRYNGEPIPGATAALYEFLATADSAGSYDVIVSGACGEPVVSAAVSVVVKARAEALADSFTTSEDVAVTGNVLSNDAGENLTASLVTQPAHGTLELNADGSFTYSPNLGFFGSDEFSYVAENDCGPSAAATVSLTITEVNVAPVAQDDAYSTLEDTALNVSAPGVLANDADADGDALEAILVDGPAHGVVTLNADGSFLYTPLAGFFGTDSFTYQATDGVLLSEIATVVIEVAHVNHPPVATDDSLTIAENSGTHPIDVLANDTDPDGDELTVTSVTQPANGVAALIEGGVSYTPNLNFHGTDSFTYTISDGNGGTATATVTITVEHIAVAPVAQDDLYQVFENDVLEVAAPGVLANDVNLEPTTLTAALVTGPAHGAVTFNADGSFTYVPADNYNGPDSFTYRANNQLFDSNLATVHITVIAVNGASDLDLYVKTASAKLSRTAENRDSLAIRGQINPRGMKDNLTGATIGVRINNHDVLAPVTLDAAGRAVIQTGALKASLRLAVKNGAYSIKITGANLREAFDLPNQTEAGATVVKVRLQINDADLEVPVITANLEASYKTAADKATSLKFSFRKNRTLTGVFNCNKTAAGQGKSGQVAITRGVITAEGGGAIEPTGDLTIQVGAETMTLPLAALVNTGTAWTYKAPAGTAGGVTGFALSSAKRTFLLAVNAADLGLPGAGGALKHDLPIQITIPTADGPMIFGSIVELKRPSSSTTKWKR
jgi:uncharacterized repeat protein (TIGR01451 family)